MGIFDPIRVAGSGVSVPGGLAAIDQYKGFKDAIIAKENRDRLAKEEARQKILDDRAAQEFKWKEEAIKKAKEEEAATKGYLADVLKGPEQRQGILTDFIDQKTVDNMVFTDEELIAQGGVKQADGTWRYTDKPKTIDPKLAESIKRKTEAQAKLGEFAGDVEGIASAAGVGKLSNAEYRKELLGKYPDLGEKVLSDLITLQAADEKARIDKTSGIDKEITDLRKELNKIPREYGGLLDKEASKSGKTSSSSGSDSGEGFKRNRISDAQKTLTATLNETFKGSSAKGAAQVKALEAFDEMVASGVDPKVAAEVVGDSTKKDSTWWGLGSDTGEVKIPNDFKQQLIQRAKSSTIPGVGTSGGSDNYTTTASERAALKGDATRLQNEIAALEKKKKLANMTPEEKTRLVINEAFDEFVKPKAKAAETSSSKSTATVSGNGKANVADKVDEFGQTEKANAAAQERMLKDAGVREAAELKENGARFQELYTKKNKTEADFKELETLAKYLDANGVAKQDLFKTKSAEVPKTTTTTSYSSNPLLDVMKGPEYYGDTVYNELNSKIGKVAEDDITQSTMQKSARFMTKLFGQDAKPIYGQRTLLETSDVLKKQGITDPLDMAFVAQSLDKKAAEPVLQLAHAKLMTSDPAYNKFMHEQGLEDAYWAMGTALAQGILGPLAGKVGRAAALNKGKLAEAAKRAKDFEKIGKTREWKAAEYAGKQRAAVH